MIVPHYRPSFGNTDKKVVQEVIETGYIAQGDRVRELEKTLAVSVGKRYGVAVSSGTTALSLALRALDVQAAAEVIIPSYTCTALWHAVKAVAATPVFADIETEFFNLDPENVRKKITSNTAAIIFPHMFGQPGRIPEIVSIGIPVIEDIAQAAGARIGKKPAGSFGKISIGSFYATKVIGAGEGGIIFTDDKTVASYLRDIRDYDEKPNLIPRLNAKMTDLNAAIALNQYYQLPKYTQTRKTILDSYRSVFKSGIIIPNEKQEYRSNLYRCIICHPDYTADELIELGKSAGITIRKPVFQPVHTYFNASGFPNTESAWKSHVSIPIFPDMTSAEITTVTQFLTKLGTHND